MLAAAGAEIVGRSQPEAGMWGKDTGLVWLGGEGKRNMKCMVVNPALHTLLSFPLQLLFSAEKKFAFQCSLISFAESEGQGKT